MTEWVVGDVSHRRQAGVFRLHVWPLKASEECSYGAWALIPEDGDSSVLPSSARARQEFTSLDEAKEWIEKAVRKVCQTAMADLE